MGILQETIFPSKVKLREEDHRYFHIETGEEYTSFSKLKGRFEKQFNADYMAPKTARKIAREDTSGKVYSQKDIDLLTEKVKSEWTATAKRSTDHGTAMHLAIEEFYKTGIYHPVYEPWIRKVTYFLKDYPVTYDEVVCYDEECKVAGTADKPCARTKGKKSIIDIYDYKTNLEKGIQFSSKYNDFMLPPFSHIEQCNYNGYSIQLSTYARMLEKWGFTIGRLAIIFLDGVNPDYSKIIPCNYLRNEADMLLNSNKSFLQKKGELEFNLNDEF